MASLYIKDPRAAEAVARLAERLGTSKTDIVRRGVAALEATLVPVGSDDDYVAAMEAYRMANPLPRLTRSMPDKVFYDLMSTDADS